MKKESLWQCANFSVKFALYPALFFERGITAVMGTRIIDPWTMLTVVSETGGTKKLHQYCGEKVAFRKKANKRKISSLEREKGKKD
ncbi:MAG: DUF364 domain-containing protein [Methanosarcina sp.]|jgi:hypothetical protein